MTNRSTLAGATLAVLALAACSSSATTATTAAAPNGPAVTAAPATTAPADPYQVYLGLAPADAPELTPDDAQTRALLGCGTAWAPGTVDAALQQAYAPLIEQWKQQGLCGS